MPGLLPARWLDPLAREKAVDGVLVHTQDAPDAHGIEAAVVDQSANRLWVDAQLPGDVPDAVEAPWLGVD